ncbi:M23 family metallopeptidase [bacterium]|nr:M23 family metallopeptidase [bacterium]
MGKKLTIILIPDTASKPRKIYISRKLIKYMSFLGLTGMVFLGFLVYNYLGLKRQVVNIAELKEENRQQKLHLNSLTKDIESLNNRLNHLNNSNNKLQILAGIKDPHNNKQVFGVGGGIADGMYEFSRTNLARLVEQMHEELENLELEMIDQENTLLEMTTLIEDRKSILDSTPAIWPTKGWITSKFGYRKSPYTGKKVMHSGLDIASRRGTPIVATARGIVTFSGIKGNYGKVVALAHGYGFTTIYGHNSVNLVKVGDKVERGDVIAYLGNTGRSTAPHLHYEVRVNEIPVNPAYYMLD